MNKLLLIVDPQIDFIDGSLPVPGAVAAMDALASYLFVSASQYAEIIVTADFHPIDHCSFKRNGGAWPVHCVADSVGAAIWPALMERLCDITIPVKVLHKGEETDREEYSIFSNESAARFILEEVAAKAIDRIDLCGLAGDVCVAATLTDGIDLLKEVSFKVLTDFTSSLDGGERLNQLIASIVK